jgi:hypothetical protein
MSDWRRYRWCERKRYYATWDEALTGSAETWNKGSRVEQDHANPPMPYNCQFCDGYHIGHGLGLKPKPWRIDI